MEIRITSRRDHAHIDFETKKLPQLSEMMGKPGKWKPGGEFYMSIFPRQNPSHRRSMTSTEESCDSLTSVSSLLRKKLASKWKASGLLLSFFIASSKWCLHLSSASASKLTTNDILIFTTIIRHRVNHRANHEGNTGSRWMEKIDTMCGTGG